MKFASSSGRSPAPPLLHAHGERPAAASPTSVTNSRRLTRSFRRLDGI
jgi:hypothetical protein